MPKYVDGYVLPVPRKNIRAYQRMALKAGKIWMEHGALEFRECVGDDLKVKWGPTFPTQFKLKTGETLMFSWITFKSRAHRDRVNAKVMKDPRLDMSGGMPFDPNRMCFGGFIPIVDLG